MNSKKTVKSGSETIILDALFETEEAGRVVEYALPQLLKKWAGKSFFKGLIVKAVSRGISRNNQDEIKNGNVTTVSELCKDPEFTQSLLESVPEISNVFFDAGSSVIKSFENINQKEKVDFIKKIISTSGLEKSGLLITGLAKEFNNIYEDDPLFLSQQLKPLFVSLLQNTDFGEIKELLDKSSDDITSIIKIINEEMWNYPGKVVALLSCLPSLLNIIIASIYETSVPLNKISPDLLSDVLLSLLSEIDGKKVGETINEFSEIIRKIHTGSTLLGEAGVPKLSANTTLLFKNIMNALDVKLFFKTQSLFAAMKDDVSKVIDNELKRNPDFRNVYIKNWFASRLRSLDGWNKKIQSIEELFSVEELSEEIVAGVSSIDPQVLAETVNSLIITANSIKENNPQILENLLSQFFDSIDIYEASETVNWFIEGLTESMKPHAGAIVPPLLKGAAAMIRSASEINGDDTGEALEMLQESLTIKGGTL